MSSDVFVIVAAYNEADRIAATLASLAEAFPGARLWVADDGSSDGTADVAEAAGATVVRSERMVGKGAAVTLAAYEALRDTERGRLNSVDGDNPPRAHAGHRRQSEPVAVLCDGDLDESSARLGPLVEAVRQGEADLAVAAFSRRVGGGFGLAIGFAHWAIRRRCGLELRAPISGQRALTAQTLAQVLPFAHGFGMEIGMTIDAARAGARVGEIDLDLSHRATGRTLGGFLHRGRQLVDFVRVYLARR
ncbi:MAG TPA: glycosyltransferase family 2 protein [Solirubrobacteraceae bacterium]|jgi:glycosyltransferase involved in cell wall biosynthesis|nr:glycosyltransferase family 2 protein [Solirubrobacteraceae bacterium]